MTPATSTENRERQPAFSAAGLLAALVQRWRDKAREIDKGQCDIEDLVKRDTLYWCAEELNQVSAMAFGSKEAANAEIRDSRRE